MARKQRFIRRREGSPYWWYDFTVKGVRFRGSCETDSPEVAEIIAGKKRADALIDAVTGKKPSLSLDAAFARYWLDHAHALPSASEIKRAAQKLIAYIGGATRLDALDNAKVSSYVSRRRGDRKILRNGEPADQLVSATTVNLEVDVLRAVCRRAADQWGLAVGAVNWKAHRLRTPAGRDRYATPEEADRLMAHAADHLKGPLLFALCTGARRSNLVNLDWSQVDLRARTVTFRQKSKTPGGRSHTVPLAAPLWLFLANLDPQESGPVWLYKGQALRDWSDAYAGACKRAKVVGLRWHDLRHTAASWMLKQRIPLKVVGEILGHADIRTTARYAHVDQAAKVQGTDAIAAHWRHTETAEPEKQNNVKDLTGTDD